MKSKVAVLAVANLTLVASAVEGHHSSNLYELDRMNTGERVLTKVEWINPHPAFYFDIENVEGIVTNWQLEGISPAFHTNSPDEART